MTDICIDGLCKSFGDRQVLDRLTLRIPCDRPTCLMAPSGYGKTTLLNLILGLLTPDAGQITGADVRMCPVFQEDRLSSAHSARENLRPVLSRHTPPSEIDSCLAELGIDRHAAGQPTSALSGGMARRVALARALLAEGEWLILDEPFRGLDEESRARAAAVILARRRDRGLLLVSHDAAEAELLSCTVLHLDRENL